MTSKAPARINAKRRGVTFIVLSITENDDPRRRYSGIQRFN